jgi:hypothetical protein
VSELRVFDPADMALRGRIGGFTTHSRHDSREITRAARETFLANFLKSVDPENLLPDGERHRRAESLRRAHFARLARLSALARRKAV